MKKLTLTILLLTFISINAQIVNIPDINFKNALLNQSPIIDTNNDGEIQISEAESFAELLDVSGTSPSNLGFITDLTGIEAFINITELNCNFNQITNLDLSNNVLLQIVNCNINQISNINISQNINLKTLRCNNNLLSNIDISQNTLLEIFSCTDNNLTNIDISKNTSLITLFCGENFFTTINVTQNVSLESFGFNFGQVSTIDITQNVNLNSLEFMNNQISVIDLSQNINLEVLLCEGNDLTTLDLTNNTLLSLIRCHQNQLTNLDLTQNIGLGFLTCGNNELTSLNLTQNINLSRLFCENNLLTNLDLSNNTNLRGVECQSNPNLTSINLKNGNNDIIAISGSQSSEFNNLPNLENVCIDDVNSSLAAFISNQVGHEILFSEDCVLSINDNSFIDLQIYPNPTNNILNIKSNSEIQQIEIFNLLGQSVLKQNNEVFIKKINVTLLKKGIYTIKLIDVNKQFTFRKFIKK